MNIPFVYTRMGAHLLAACNARLAGQRDEPAEADLLLLMEHVLKAVEGEGPFGKQAITSLELRPSTMSALLVRMDGAKVRADLLAEQDHVTMIRTGYHEDPWG